MIKNKTFLEKYWYIILLFGFLILLIYGKNNQEINSELLKSGINTTGIVIDKEDYKGNSPGTKNYIIKFEFYVKDSIIRNISFKANKEQYEKAIIGNKYLVKYLPNKPQNNSIIMIDVPSE